MNQASFRVDEKLSQVIPFQWKRIAPVKPSEVEIGAFSSIKLKSNELKPNIFDKIFVATTASAFDSSKYL